MHVNPAIPVPRGTATPADVERAKHRLSVVHGREVRGGLAVEQLAAEYAAAFQAGYDAALRELATAGGVS